MAGLVAVTLPVLSQATAITTIYDASQGSLPTAQSFLADVDSHAAVSVSGGVLHVDNYTQGVDNRPAYYYEDLPGTFLLSTFVMEVNVQIMQSTQRSAPGSGNYPRGGFQLEAVDNLGRDIGLQISDSGVWLQTSDGVANNSPASSFLTFDTTNAFHNYRVEGNGSLISLFVDNASIAALTFSTASLQVSGGAANSVLFGDASVLTRSNFDLRYALFSSDLSATAAPEPGTIGLFSLAAVGLWLKRRR